MNVANGGWGFTAAKAYSINCRGRLLDLSSPVVMGILNVTPDSFYDGGKFTEERAILEKAGDLVRGGATIIDIGGASSRPGSAYMAEEVELKRVLPAVALVRKSYPDIIISVDTWRSKVAREAVASGADMVNDISAGLLDADLLPAVAELKVPYVLMHMKGNPADMQASPSYENVTAEVLRFLQNRIAEIRDMGILDVLVDPGFGFGKSVDDNFRLLNDLDAFQLLDCPVLAGISRKSMVYKSLKINANNSLTGTISLNTIALLKGASVLRVHDAEDAIHCIRLVEKLKAVAGSNCSTSAAPTPQSP